MLLTLIEHLIDKYFAFIPRSKPLRQHCEQALLVAHRGAHSNNQGIFENTIAAFKKARETGCWGIELDVHATRDGQLIVNHDPTLNRLWNHDVSIADLSFVELRALEPDIPSLNEVVEEFGHSMHLFIELKTPFNHEEELVQVLKDLTPCKDYHLLALEAATFRNLSHFPVQSLLLVAVHNNVSEFCDLSLKMGYGGVLGNYLLMTNRYITQLKEADQAYGVGFVDSKFCMFRELNRGVYWIFTNRAVDVSSYLKCLKVTN